MTKATVLLVTNLDTRGAEFAAVRDLFARYEVGVMVMDVSMEQSPDLEADIGCGEVARAGGLSIDEVRAAYSTERKLAVDCMVRGGGAIARRLYDEGRVQGIMGAGGATATLVCTSIMKRLPFGVPKVMASSVGGHPSYVGRYVGTRDIMMLNTVVDVMGMNPLLWRQYANAVGAVCGAVQAATAEWPRSTSAASGGGPPLVGVTSFGFSERAVESTLKHLRDSGFEPVPFHAQGRGDRAMDELIRDGTLHGVVDMVTRGIGEETLGGNCAAGPDRILAAAESGLPQVLAPCGLDMVSVGGQPDWRERFAGRAYAVIDELRVEVRTTAEECRAFASVVAERLNQAKASHLFLLPTGGWTSLGRPGAPLHDPVADDAFVEELRRRLDDPTRVRVVPADGYSPEFGEACAAAFVEVWTEAGARAIERPPRLRR